MKFQSHEYIFLVIIVMKNSSTGRVVGPLLQGCNSNERPIEISLQVS